MKIYSYDNHIFNNDIIEKLIYTSINNVIKKNSSYILINISTYSPYHIYNKEYNMLYDLSIDKKVYINLLIPKLYIYKIIVVKNDNNISLISNCIFENNNIYDFLNILINIIINDLEIINNLLIKISEKNKKTNELYVSINILSYVSTHILYFDNYIDKIMLTINYLQNSKNEKNILIIDRINLINQKLKSIKFYYDNIKTTSLQQLTHQEAIISKILTYVATIFLPISFIIAVFSLPVKNIPFRNNENAIYVILFILFLICVISSFYLIELNKTNIFI